MIGARSGTNQTHPIRSGRPRRWLRRLAGALCLIATIILLAWQALTSSWFLTPRIEAVLSPMVGGRVMIGHSDLGLDGRLQLTDVRLLVPSVRGPAGELVHVPDLTINLDRRDLLAGRITARRLIIDDALLRLSEDLDSGRFNVGGLALAAPGASAPITEWPQIELRSGIVQIGEHRLGAFRASGEIRVDGSLRPPPAAGADAGDWYSFDLREVKSTPSGTAPAGAMRLTGRFNLATGEASSIISDVTFDPQQAALLPRVAREWWQIIEPSGALQPIAVQIKPGGGYEIEITMDGIDWSLPVPSFDPSRDILPPRMTDVRGSVVIHDGVVDLIGLSGKIDGVHYQLSGLFTSVDRSPGFDLTFEVAQFDVSRNLNVLTALPAKVRRLVDDQLVQLGGPSGLLDAHVTLHRDALEAGVAASEAPASRPVRASGRVELLNAEGTYAGFPYPLSGLHGAVEFDDQEIRIMSLAGRGPTGGQVYLSGRIAPLDADPQVEAEMYANNVPLDEHLLAALGPSRGKAITEFFNPQWMERLQAAGLILTESDVEPISEEVMQLMRRHREITESAAPDPQRQEQLEAILARVKEIEADLGRVFQLGGRVNIRSTIRRERGPGQPTKVSNYVTLADRSRPLGVIYEEFPYPARLVDGEVLIEYDRVTLVKDLVLEGVGGGRAVISGEVRRVREPVRRQEPDLAIHVEGIPVNELLLRAIPGGEGGRSVANESAMNGDLSRAARILAGLRLGGDLRAEGRIFADERGKADFDINVRLTNGASRQAGDRPRWETGLDWLWPATLPVSDAAAEVTVHRRSVDIHRFEGRSGEQEFAVSGRIAWSGGSADVELDAEARRLDLLPHLIDLASPLGSDEGIEEMRGFWDRLQPQGRADAALTYRQVGDEPTLFDLTLEPRFGSLLLDGRRVETADAQGTVQIRDGAVRFTDLHADASCEGAAVGRITLDGAMGYRDDRAWNLHGRIEGGRFEAPVFDRFAAGLSGLLSRNADESVAPRGAFDASFHLTREIDEPRPSYLINVQPGELDFTLGSERFEVRRLEGAALITPDAFELLNLAGSYQDGLIQLAGRVDRSRGVDADLRLSVSADRLTGRVRALLPRAVNDLIDAIDLDVGQSVELTEARIRYGRQPASDAAPAASAASAASAATTSTASESIDFAGILNVRDASMNLSIPITELDGSLDISARRNSSEPWLHGAVDMNVSRMLVLGRQVTDVRASLSAGEEPGQVELTSLVGECYGGRLSAEGQVRVPWLGEPGRYDVRVALGQVAVDPVLRRVAPRAGETAVEAAANAAPNPPSAATAPAAPGSSAPARWRPGRLAASLAVAGEFGRPESRVGRGDIRVTGAELYEVPLAMWALQLSALTLPVSTSFREADIDYYIDGNEVVFERLTLDSPAMSLRGQGVLNYQSQRLDMQFHTASKLRAPLLTPIWESLRDLFVTIRVTGTLERPEASLEPRSGAAAGLRRPARADAEPRDLVIAPANSD